ncbi:MAG: DedA family protein [Ignavibacteriaceae bacterium]|nr:DedA family protein [Ignavibacteriaceae bacterium]
MIEHILSCIAQLTPFWLLAALTFFSYFENIFPPSPSDLVVVVGGSLIGKGVISFLPTLALTTIGSVAGFMTIFYIGTTLDKKVIKTHKIKFISTEGIEKVESWFAKYGFWIIIANRFMPGTRSVISLFAGLSELDVKKTTVFCTLSALGWNAAILYLGMIFGSNVRKVDSLLVTYSNIVFAITALAIIIYLIRFFIQKKEKKNYENK